MSVAGSVNIDIGDSFLVEYEDYIYTDDLGIDYRIGSYYRYYDLGAYYYGDEILGMHKDSANKWELC